MAINETVLEMHFHHALMELFSQTLGVGATGKVNFYKYSPQRECFVGFDQAWVMTEADDELLFQDLKEAALNNSYQLSGKYVGYFLQYKVMKRMVRHMKVYPAPFDSTPYGRVLIDNKENPNTKKSQHELLFELSKNHNALAYYACPSLFDKADLYCEDVDLTKLQLVELETCASPYTDNKKHHIFFEFSSMIPTWCSDPIVGTSITPETLAKRLRNRLLESNPSSTRELLELINRLRGYVKDRRYGDLDEGNIINGALQSLTIIQLLPS